MNAQQLIIGHLLPITAGIVVLWLVYRLLFSNGNRLQFNRLFLLTAMLFSLALPFIGLQMGQSAPQMVHLKQNLLGGTLLAEITVMPESGAALPETVAMSETASRPHLSIWSIVVGIYLIGVGVTTLLLLFKLGKIVVLILRSPKEKREGYTAVFLSVTKPTYQATHGGVSAGSTTAKAKVPEPVEGPTPQGSFSFLRYAFFPDESVAPDIVRHERSHIAHGHSADILFVETMKILQWFNPFIYLYKKELQSLHEYQADRDVVATSVDKRNYMMLILQQCTAADFSGISNNFSLILTKKRIKMITRTEKAKGLWWRLLATLPVLAMLLIVNTKVSAQEQKVEKKPITVEMGQFEIYNDDGAPIQLKDTVIYGEDGSYVRFETSDALDPTTGEPCKKITVTSFDADGSPANNFYLTETEKRGDTATYKIEPFSISGSLFETLLDVATSKEDTVYQIVDEMPRFPGGEKALMEHVAKNVVYPEEAKEKEIQSRVFIGFVIEKDGSVSNVKALRGIGGGCDEEAVRVIKALPKWAPGKKDGKPVRVSYQIPINFKLNNDEPESPIKKSEISKADMKPDKSGVYQIVEEMPQYPGGEQALMDYVAKNIVYPQEAKDKEISGRVFVSFVVEKDGSINEVKVLKGIGGGCDEEAVRVVKAMPKWKPGKMKGEPVRVNYQLPVFFKL